VTPIAERRAPAHQRKQWRGPANHKALDFASRRAGLARSTEGPRKPVRNFNVMNSRSAEVDLPRW
jgi:hypothetical protein